MDYNYAKCPNCDYVFALDPDVMILTKAQVAVAQLLGNGLTTQEAAEVLFVSVKTIESHRRTVFRKLGVHNPSQLTKWAIRQGLVEP